MVYGFVLLNYDMFRVQVIFIDKRKQFSYEWQIESSAFFVPCNLNNPSSPLALSCSYLCTLYYEQERKSFGSYERRYRQYRDGIDAPRARL
jgi:hypothetical protein